MIYFAESNIHISLPAEAVFHIGPIAITNSMILGSIGAALMLIGLFHVAHRVRTGRKNIFVSTIQWLFEFLYKGTVDILGGDKILARKVAPIAITMFFLVLTTYSISVFPGVGSITWNGVLLFRGLPADLNFTFALAIVTIVASQVFAVTRHGFFGNIGRYIKNPFKNPIAAFEGILELVGELSRLVALSFRLFGNAFAGEVLLMVITVLAGYLATIALPVFMIFELFIGFIQAYVFYILTVIFTSLAVAMHGDHDTPSSHDHSAHEVKQLTAAAK